jgi:protein-disulfide isomerase
MMKQMTVGALLVGAAVVGGAAWAADGWMGWFSGNAPAKAAPVAAAAPAAPAALALVGNALDIQPNDRVIGSMTAPITMIEYASMTCSHCAHFATEVMPQVKKEWINTGKVKYILRDLPWDNMAVGMIKIARCAPPSQFMPITDTFFANQEKIILGNDPLGEIKKLVAPYGIDSAKADACIKDAELQVQVETSKKIAMESLQVKGTPTVFVNGQQVEKAGDYAELKKALEAAVGKGKVAR